MQKRFRLQDLQQTQVSQETRVSDDFVPMTVDGPRLPSLVDFSGIARNVGVYMASKKKKDVEKSKIEAASWAASNQKVYAEVLGEYTKAGKGLEGDALAEAHLKVGRRLREANIIPAQASQGFLGHLGDIEADRLKNRMSAELRDEAMRLSKIADSESDDRIDLEDAMEAYNGILSRYMENPLFSQSETATAVFLDNEPAARAKFEVDVQSGRWVEEEKRAINLTKQSLADGDSKFSGFASGANLTQDTREAWATAAEGKLAELELTTANHKDVFVESAFEQIESFRMSGNPAKASRLLSEVADLRTGPNLRLADDVAYEKMYLEMVDSIRNSEDDQYLRQANVRRVFDTELQSTYERHLWGALKDNYTGEAAIAEARNRTREDEGLSGIQLEAGIELDETALDGLEGHGLDILRKNRDGSRDASAEAYQTLKRAMAAGTITQDDAVRQASALGVIGDDMTKLLESTTETNWKTFSSSEASDSWRRERELRTNVDGASEELMESLSKTADSTLSAQRGIMDRGIRAGEQPEDIMKSPEWKAEDAKLQAEHAASESQVKELLKRYKDARIRRDIEGLISVSSDGEGLLDQKMVEADLDAAYNFEDRFEDIVFSSAEGEAITDDVVALWRDIVAVNDLIPGEGGVIGTEESLRSSLRVEFMKNREAIAAAPRRAQRAAISKFLNQAKATVRESMLSEKQMAHFRKVDATTPALESYALAERDRDVMKKIEAGGSPALAVGAYDPYAVESLADPSVHWGYFASGGRSPWAVTSKVSKDITRAFVQQVSADEPGVYSDNESALATQLSLAGHFSVEEATAGRGSVRVPASYAPSQKEIAAMTVEGWEFTPGNKVVTKDPDTGTVISVTGRDGYFSKDVEFTPNPYTSLLFRGTSSESGYTQLEAWLKDTPHDKRRSVYEALGRTVLNLDKEDASFMKDQTKLLDNFNHAR